MPNTISITDLELENGDVLRNPTIAYHAWGSLNDAGDNAVVVCHSLTNHSDAMEWWPGLIGPDCLLDTRRYYVICLNTLGSPYGSSSPISMNPDTGIPYGAAFPAVTIRDTVRAHFEALNMLGVKRVALAIGGSLGGMQVLEWAHYGLYVQSLVPIAVGGRHSPWGIAWTEAQRNAIYGDPNWKDGHYTQDAPPSAGLATARMMAMISYRTAGEFDSRFGRNPSRDELPGFSVESYLRYHGQKLVDRFDANCYVQLTKQMNSHDVSRGRGTYSDTLGSITQPTLVVGISSDILYPLHEQQELADLIPNATLHVLDAPYGHDSFLVESERIFEAIAPFIESWSRPESEESTRTETVVSGSAVTAVRVLKFGGSSVGRPESIRRVVKVIGKNVSKRRIIVVVSALSQVTNILEQILSDGQTDRTALLLGLYRRHVDAARELLSDKEFQPYRTALTAQLSAIIPALRRLSQHVHTRFDTELILAAGERFSAPLIAAALREAGHVAVPVDGAELIRVQHPGNGSVDLDRTSNQIRKWYDAVPEGHIPIVTGFIGASDCGNTVTLGRGGSDFTAALLSAALNAELMERWTDVDGLFTSDPKQDQLAAAYRILPMKDAEELNRASRLGMHQHTLTPLISSRIPLRVRSIHSKGPGTLVIPCDDLPQASKSVA